MPKLVDFETHVCDSLEAYTVSHCGAREEFYEAAIGKTAKRKMVVDLDFEGGTLSNKSRPLAKNSDATVSPMSTPKDCTSPKPTILSWMPSRKPSVVFSDVAPSPINSPQKTTAKRMLSAEAVHANNKENSVPSEHDSLSNPLGCNAAILAAASAIEVAGITRARLEGLDDYLKQRRSASVSLKVAAEQARAKATHQLEAFRHCSFEFESSQFLMVEQLHWTKCAQY